MLRAQRLVLNQPQKRGEGGSGGGWREGGGELVQAKLCRNSTSVEDYLDWVSRVHCCRLSIGNF